MARKQKMKVYHGVPKSITDEHTLFYESCDGKLDNSYTVVNPIGFYPSATGYEVYGKTIDEFKFALETECKIQTKVFTVDFWATMKTPVNKDYAGRIFELTFNNNSSYKIRLENSSNSNRFHLWENGNLIYGEFDFSSANINKPHHFRIIFKVGDYCKMFIDGKEPNLVQYQNKLTTSFEYISHIGLSGAHFSISDFHISNIDRGDYFPNLPQDFIEGKAIIKSRMGQQQIKGDPMYSQTTCVKIPSFMGDNEKLYNVNTKTKRGVLISNPEVCEVTINSLWNSGSSFKLKGLNCEIISGVIDTDTALARVTQKTNNSVRTIKVDDVSKLSVGDSFRLTFRDMRWVSENKVIESINSENSTITWSSSYSSETVSMDMVLIETTVSSSSPTVKTQEGTNVVGTWSGLGTSEATFTLGENSGLEGKDLYIEYTLNIPCGNSDFYELPKDVVRAYTQTGIEMKPINKIVMKDTFIGKTQGDTSICPHILKYASGSSSILPNQFTNEATTSEYSHTTISGDNYALSTSTSVNNERPKQLFSFNVVEMIERKFGCEIPSVDKVRWVKDNLASYTFSWTGYGSSPSGYYAELQVYNAKSKSWVSYSNKNHTSSSPSLISFSTGAVSNYDLIDENGFAHCMVFPKQSDGTQPSVITTDHVALSLSIQMDSNYTYLYCDDTRARGNICNPVLVQKETKTVKRLVPSNECFSTEYTYYKPKRVYGNVEQANILSKLEHGYLTTQGTGGKDWWSNTRFQSCLAYIDPTNIKPYMFTSDSIYDSKLGNTGTNQYYPLSFVKVDTTPYVSLAVAEMPMTLHGFEGNIAYLKPYLLNSCNEIKMGLLVYLYNKGVLQTSYDYNFDIPNKPLIK